MKAISRSTALIVLITLLLSACGGGATPPAAAPTAGAAPEASSAPAAPEATAAPAPAASGDKVKITWWTENAEEPRQQALKRDFVDTFNAEHPNIELEISFKDQL